MTQSKSIEAPILQHVYRLLTNEESALVLATSLLASPMVGEHGNLVSSD
jgi:hypothetical protein